MCRSLTERKNVENSKGINVEGKNIERKNVEKNISKWKIVSEYDD